MHLVVSIFKAQRGPPHCHGVFSSEGVTVCYVGHYELFQSWNEEGSIIFFFFFEAVTAAGRWEDEEKWKRFKYHLALVTGVVRAQACATAAGKGVP